MCKTAFKKFEADHIASNVLEAVLQILLGPLLNTLSHIFIFQNYLNELALQYAIYSLEHKLLLVTHKKPMPKKIQKKNLVSFKRRTFLDKHTLEY